MRVVHLPWTIVHLYWAHRQDNGERLLSTCWSAFADCGVGNLPPEQVTLDRKLVTCAKCSELQGEAVVAHCLNVQSSTKRRKAMISIKTNSGDMPNIPKELKRKVVKGTKPPVSVAPSERKLLSPSEAMAVEGRDTRLPKNVEPAGTAILNAAREAKAAAKKAAKPVKAPKPTREGLITVASIAEEYGLIPRVARGLLRAAKIAKPSVGWAYDAKDAALVKVRGVLKAGKATPRADSVRGDKDGHKKAAPSGDKVMKAAMKAVARDLAQPVRKAEARKAK